MPTPIGRPTKKTPVKKGDGKLDLYEYGRERLGYGDWWSGLDEPYWKYAGMEAHKLSLSMRKHRITPEEFRLLVDYAHAQRLRIEHPVWLFRLLPEAKLWRSELRSREPSDIEREIADAVARERTLADHMSQDWITRLIRARGDYRKEVLQEWVAARSSESRSNASLR